MNRSTTSPPHRVQGSLTDYLSASASVSESAISENEQAMECCHVIDRVLREAVDSVSEGAPPAAQLLNMHSRILYCSAVRAALAGDLSPLAPILRASLESACYAQEIQIDPSLQDVWMKRHDGKDERKKSRQVFGSGVIQNVCKRLSALIQGDPRIITEHYDRLVDYGAHPNVAAVLHGASMRETDDHWIIERGGPAPKSVEANLFFVFETGLYTAMVIANGGPMSRDLKGLFVDLMKVRANWEDQLRIAASTTESKKTFT